MTTSIPLETRPHALYRFYGAGDTLLYIGITADLPTRITDHSDEKAWWLGVARITVEHYPDRASVLEAEKRAIIAERPLYNIRHNPAPLSAKPHTAVAPSSPLVPVCMGCRQPIPRGDRGVVHISHASIAYVQREWRDRDRFEDAWTPIDLKTLLGQPDPAMWMVHCDDCNPHPHPHDPRSWCHGCYWFSVDRCRTWAQLIDWTAHLSQKDWLTATDWMDFIRRTAHGQATTGLVAINRADTHGADA